MVPLRRSLLAAVAAGALRAAEAAPPWVNGENVTDGCDLESGLVCHSGSTRLTVGTSCDPVCGAGETAVGPMVCLRENSRAEGPGCVATADLPAVTNSDVDAVLDATSSEDMVFKRFSLANGSHCLLYPGLPGKVKGFIIEQAGKYGPSAAAIRRGTKLGKAEHTEFFLSIEQVSVLLAQLLCGASRHLDKADIDHSAWGAGDRPQSFAFGRAMEHWFMDDDGMPRCPQWRRTTLVGYGTFGSDANVPDGLSTVSTHGVLNISSGCGKGQLADWGLGDRETMTVVFAGHYVGGWLSSWYHANSNGAQEEKFGTLVPEMMLATETLRHMGAGLLSSGKQDPWLPEGGWYIIGAGSYVKSRGYPLWSPEKMALNDKEDYFPVGNGRRMRKRGVVAIIAKPCNDRGSCGTNTDDAQFKCYNRQVEDHDILPDAEGGANLWGIAGGAFNFANWPARTARLLESAQVTQKWVLQAGGWGAGAFGCGSVYGGLVQALAAKSGGWENMRMCYATREEQYPTIESKLGFVVSDQPTLKYSKIVNIESYTPLMTHVKGHRHCSDPMATHPEPPPGPYVPQPTSAPYHGWPFNHVLVEVEVEPMNDYHHGWHSFGATCGGFILFEDRQYGAVAGQLYKEIKQHVVPPSCAPRDPKEHFTDGMPPLIKCNRPGASGDCHSSMNWCCANEGCSFHKDPEIDLRDVAARYCNPLCGKSRGICLAEDVPHRCRRGYATLSAKDYKVNPAADFVAEPLDPLEKSQEDVLEEVPDESTEESDYDAQPAKSRPRWHYTLMGGVVCIASGTSMFVCLLCEQGRRSTRDLGEALACRGSDIEASAD